MATINLDSRQRDDGKRLIAALGSTGIQFDAAFWTRPASLNEWRFILVTPLVETKGPKHLLREAFRALENMNGQASFSYFDIDFQSPRSAHVALLASKLPGVVEDSDLGSIMLGDYAMEGFMMYFMKTDRILAANGHGGSSLVGAGTDGAG